MGKRALNRTNGISIALQASSRRLVLSYHCECTFLDQRSVCMCVCMWVCKWRCTFLATPSSALSPVWNWNAHIRFKLSGPVHIQWERSVKHGQEIRNSDSNCHGCCCCCYGGKLVELVSTRERKWNDRVIKRHQLGTTVGNAHNAAFRVAAVCWLSRGRNANASRFRTSNTIAYENSYNCRCRNWNVSSARVGLGTVGEEGAARWCKPHISAIYNSLPTAPYQRCKILLSSKSAEANDSVA